MQRTKVGTFRLAACAVAADAGAQLRPLEPFEWRMFDAGRAVAAQVGTG